MTNLNRVVIGLLSIICIVSCGNEVPTFNDNVRASLANHFDVDSVSNMEVVDSLMSDELSDIMANLYEVKKINDEALLTIPVKLDSAKVKLDKAKMDLENSNSILDFAFEGLVKDWEGIIEDKEESLKNAENLKVLNNTEIEFVEKAEKGIVNNVAYYFVNCENNSKTVSVAMDPSFKVLRIFE